MIISRGGRYLIALGLACCVPVAWGADSAANVVSVQGTGQFSEGEQKPWRPARVEQALHSGNFVRTAEYSRMGLLFRDRTQIRISEKTLLRIKDTEKETRLRIDVGRAWTQSKMLPHGLYLETPSATAAIRGTDWDLEVDASGRTLITVLSGEVEFFNEFGRVSVGRNESAEALVGKAPTKLVLVRPKDRVQWVTAFAIEPLRRISLSGRTLAEARQVIEQPAPPSERGRALADLGRWAEAEAAFREALAAAPADAMAHTGLAYVALHRGKPDDARTQLARAAAQTGHDAQLIALGRIAADVQSEDLGAAFAALTALTREAQLRQPAAYLLLADLMLYAGDASRAEGYLQQGLSRFPRDARLGSLLARVYLVTDERAKGRAELAQALQRDPGSYEARVESGELARIEGDERSARQAFGEAIALKPADDRAWFGLGRLSTEKEDVRKARAQLLKALELNSQGTGYQGELGTLETFANNFGAARSAYQAALTRKPDDYVALTGLGLLELKQGHTDAALEAFLRASMTEPRFARVHVYAAVAYYQMGRTAQALEALARASELDDKDPLPHFMASIIHNDQLRPADAIDAARSALRLMPNLKSLNQVASNQRGTTNLGQAFAFFGMEEWAQSYAQESYNQFWAGSHLFLADRYHGLFTKNSELFQGFLADPTAFGASTRNQTLLQRPGNYFTGSLRVSSQAQSFHGNSPLVQVNGFANGSVPFAYFANHERFDLKFTEGPTDITFSNIAFGIAPRHDIGIFLFANENSNKSTLRTAAWDLRDQLRTTNVDAGFHVKFSPTSQLWLKAATFDSSDNIGGLLTAIPTTSAVKVRQPEFLLRHTFMAGDRHEISWGVEQATRKTSSAFYSEVFPGLQMLQDYAYRERTFDAYVSDRWRAASRLLVQGELFYQRHRRSADYVTTPILFGIPLPVLAISDAQSMPKSRMQPRLGFVYRASDDLLLRGAYQRWLRPAQFSSLGPVATAGIPLDDRMVQRGGEMSRWRGQLEWEASSRSFVNVYVDAKKVRHNPFSLSPFTVSDLETLNRLTSRDLGALVRDDLLEFALSPDYQAGRIRQLGAAFNHLLTRQWGLFGRYVNTSSKNTGAGFPGNRLPYLPRHAAAVGASWIDPAGWYFIGRLINRSERFKDEANTMPLKAGWNAAFDLYWQSKDKHWLFRLSADDALDKNKHTQYTAEATFRF